MSGGSGTLPFSIFYFDFVLSEQHMPPPALSPQAIQAWLGLAMPTRLTLGNILWVWALIVSSLSYFGNPHLHYQTRTRMLYTPNDDHTPSP